MLLYVGIKYGVRIYNCLEKISITSKRRHHLFDFFYKIRDANFILIRHKRAGSKITDVEVSAFSRCFLVFVCVFFSLCKIVVHIVFANAIHSNNLNKLDSSKCILQFAVAQHVFLLMRLSQTGCLPRY